MPEARAAEAPKISPVLTTPPKLEASASASIDLPITLDGTDGVPARSSIAISGLPDGATLSTGRPYGATGWNLKSDEIGDLRLNLPDTSSGEAKLAIELVAPHGEVLAKAETFIKMTPAPEAEAATPADGEVPVMQVATTPVGPADVQGLKPVPLGAREDTQGSAQAEEAKPVATTAEATDNSQLAKANQKSPSSGAPKPMALAAADPRADDADAETIAPSQFVNLRDGPTSSAKILGVVPKGSKLAVLDRKRGWVQVTHPATEQVGWIYDGTHWAPRARRGAKPADSEESFWTRLGRSLAGSAATPSEEN